MMNKSIYSKLSLVIAAMAVSLLGHAQVTTPAPSPTATIKQTVGLTDVEVTYSRPGMKGRKIFGDLLAYGEVWRAGANASTKISFSDNVKLAGNEVPAGKYALYAIPGEQEWTIIIHKNTELWGAGNYNANDDLVRFKVRPTQLKDKLETLTIDFSNFEGANAHLNIGWENTLVSIPITTDVDAKIMAQIKTTILDNKGEVDARSYQSAATYYYETNRDLNQALAWMDKAIAANPDAFWAVHAKAKILAKMGKKKEAIATAGKSMEMAKNNKDGDFGYVKNNENLIAEIKAKK